MPLEILTQEEADKRWPKNKPRYLEFDPCYVVCGTLAELRNVFTTQMMVNGKPLGGVVHHRVEKGFGNLEVDKITSKDTRVIIWKEDEGK